MFCIQFYERDCIFEKDLTVFPCIFVGRYCLQTSCDLHPCQNGGVCSLVSDGYVCTCPRGFGGPHCKRQLLPCETQPCVNGICIEDTTRMDGYKCQCHLWWIGKTKIQYTPLRNGNSSSLKCLGRTLYFLKRVYPGVFKNGKMKIFHTCPKE